MSKTVIESIFTGGGPVYDSGVYIPRRADDELLELCRALKYSYILTARQMGKSSLMVRTAEQLEAEGTRAVIIDLTKTGVSVSEDEWYYGMLDAVVEDLGLDIDFVEWWTERSHLSRTERFTSFFEKEVVERVEGKRGVVVFIDEIDTTISLPFSDDFFAAVRYLFTGRARNAALKRLSFVLIGVASPAGLIADPSRTPFNVGERVVLTDFTYKEALPFADGLGLPREHAREVLKWVHKWTSGHPYLTQRLCMAVLAEVGQQRREALTEADVDRLAASTFLSQKSAEDLNLVFVRDMLLGGRIPEPLTSVDVLLTYREVRRGRRVPDEERSLVKAHLKLSGVVCPDGGVLRVRNRIYETAFDEKWIREHLPENWIKQQYQRTRKLAMGLAAVLLVVGGLAVTTALAYRAASSQAERAEKQTALAEEQKRVAEEQTAFAQEQKRIANAERARAEAALAEAERQRAVAEQRRNEAEAQRKEAERQRQVAEAAARQARELAAARAAATKAAEEARRTAEEAKRAAEEANKREAEAREQSNKLVALANEDSRRQAERADLLSQELAIERSLNQAQTSTSGSRSSTLTRTLQSAVQKIEEEIIPAYEKVSDKAGKGLALTNLARTYTQLRDYPQALESYNQAAQAYYEAGKYESQGDSLAAAGDLATSTRVSSAPPGSALDSYTKARAAYHAAGNVKKEADTYTKLGETIVREAQRAATEGQPPSGDALRRAADAFDQARALYARPPAQAAAGFEYHSAVMKRAEIARALNERAKSIELYKDAYKRLMEEGDTSALSYTLSAILDAHAEGGEGQQAAAYIDEIRKTYQTENDRNREFVHLLTAGRFYGASNRQQAMGYFAEALKVAQQHLTDPNSLGRVFEAVWEMYTSKPPEDRAAALKYFESVLAERQAAGDRLGEADVRYAIATADNSSPDMDWVQKLGYFVDAYKLFQQEGDDTQAASLLASVESFITYNYFKGGNSKNISKEVIAAINEKLAGVPENDTPQEARLLVLRGFVQITSEDAEKVASDLAEAARLYGEAAARAKQSGNHAEAESLYLRQADTLFGLGSFYTPPPIEKTAVTPEDAPDTRGKALDALRRAADIYDDDVDKSQRDYLQGRALQAIARVLRTEEAYLEALARFEKAEHAPRDRVDAARASVYYDLATFYDNGLQGAKAAEAFSQALSLYPKTAPVRGRIKILRGISSHYLKAGDAAKAMEYLNEAARIYDASGDFISAGHLFREMFYTRNVISIASSDNTGVDLLKRASEFYAKGHSIYFQALVLRSLADFYTRMMKTAEAEEVTRRAEALEGWRLGGTSPYSLNLVREPGAATP